MDVDESKGSFLWNKKWTEKKETYFSKSFQGKKSLY